MWVAPIQLMLCAMMLLPRRLHIASTVLILQVPFFICRFLICKNTGTVLNLSTSNSRYILHSLHFQVHVDSLVQDCGNASALDIDVLLLQTCTHTLL